MQILFDYDYIATFIPVTLGVLAPFTRPNKLGGIFGAQFVIIAAHMPGAHRSSLVEPLILRKNCIGVAKPQPGASSFFQALIAGNREGYVANINH